jgi:hypothetical protein
MTCKSRSIVEVVVDLRRCTGRQNESENEARPNTKVAHDWHLPEEYVLSSNDP